MNIERTKDKELIKKIMFTKGLWETASEDGITKEEFDPDVENDVWLVFFTSDKIIGCYLVEPKNSVMIEVHPNIIPKYRKKYTKETGIVFFKWVLSDKRIKKLISYIPVIYPNVRDFCLDFGLKHEGINRLSTIKNGELHDQWMMGITRDEIEEYINDRSN